MRLYPIRLFKLFVVSAGAAIVGATVFLNAMLPPMKEELIHAVSKHFSQNVTVGRVVFVPPSFVIFKDIAVYDPPDDEPIFVIPLARAHLALSDIVLHKRLRFSRVDFHDFSSSSVRFRAFIRNNYRQIIDFLRAMPVQDIRIVVNRAQLESEDEKHGSRHYAAADAIVEIKDGVIALESVVQPREVYLRSKRSIAGAPWALRMRFQFTGRGFLCDNAEIAHPRWYAKAWGRMEAGELTCNGFSFFNTAYSNEEYRGDRADAPRFFSLVRVPRFSSVPALSMSDADLVILDVNASCLLALPRVDIRSLSMAINNVPITLKGQVTFGTPAAIDIRGSASAANTQGVRALKGIKKIDAGLKGYFQNTVFRGDGMVNLILARDEKSNNPLDRISLNFRQAEFFIEGAKKQLAHFGRINIQCQSPSNQYAVTIDRAAAVIRHQREKLFDVRFNALLCGGRMRAKALIDGSSIPPRVEAVMVLKNLDTQRLDSLLVHFSKVYGRLFGEMKFVSLPKPVLKGNISILRGALRDFEFFRWLSEQLVLPSLRYVSFAKTSLGFTVEREASRMYLIDLVSSGVRLGGFFRLDAKNFVSSKLSLALHKDSLRESPKLKGLAGALEPGYEYLDFDFQLSGPLQSMNFQWLESPAKRRLQELIPNFIERKLEKNVEHMLAP